MGESHHTDQLLSSRCVHIIDVATLHCFNANFSASPRCMKCTSVNMLRGTVTLWHTPSLMCGVPVVKLSILLILGLEIF